MTDLTLRLRAAAAYLDEHGWVQHTMGDPGGAACLTGAIRFCAPQDGDEHLIRQVLARRDRAEDWNDAGDRTRDEVVGYLSTAEITDADLAETFGPQWEAVVALVRRAATLTETERDNLHAARDAAWVAARAAARAAARDAAWVAAWAVCVRDLIGQHGFTQQHYDTLTGPWAQVVGKAHPDD